MRPSFLTSGPDPLTLLHALRRRWLPALACGLAAAMVVAAIAWFVIPADHKWYRNWAVAALLTEVLTELDPQFPPASFDVEAEKARLAQA